MTSRRERLRKALKHGVNALIFRRTAPVPVFLFGEMRSGTNTLLDCFDNCLAVETFNETDSEAFADYELRDLQTIAALVARSRASHVVFKPTADTIRAAEIIDAFPGSRSVWIYRRYQDAVNSAMDKWKQHNEYLRLILEEPARARWRARHLTPDDLLLIRTHHSRGLSEESARALIWYLRNRSVLRDRLDERVDLLLVCYEDLVREPNAQVSAVFDFVGLPFKSRYASHLATSSVRRSPDPELDRQIEKLCMDLTGQLLDATRRQRARLTLEPK